MATARTAPGDRRRESRRSAPRDDLEDYIEEQTKLNPEFPALMEQAAQRKRLLKELAMARQAAGLTQTVVAARMQTSTSAVARLERGEMNPTMVTLQRFASAIGKRVEMTLADEPRA